MSDNNWTPSWKWFRETAVNTVREFFAPLKHWRHGLAGLLMLCTALIPFYQWFTIGYVTLGAHLFLPLMVWMFIFIGIPMSINIWPGKFFPKSSLGIMIGTLASVPFVIFLSSNSVDVDASQAAIITGDETIIDVQENTRRYAPWDSRDFIIVDGARGEATTIFHAPCEDTVCSTTITVNYRYDDMFIVLNHDAKFDFATIVDRALVRAVHVDGLTETADIEAAMCRYMGEAMGFGSLAGCPATLTFDSETFRF